METSVGEDAASVLMLLSPRQQGGARGRVFECKTCGRRFPTFQALGGHRASHRRPKPYPYDSDPGLRRTSWPDLPREGECAPKAAAGPSRLHGCPICGLEFAVGQALGGHMRRHRAAAAGSECKLRSGDANATSVEEADIGSAGCCTSGLCLDLILAPSENCAKCRNNAVLGNSDTVHGKSMISDCPRL